MALPYLLVPVVVALTPTTSTTAAVRGFGTPTYAATLVAVVIRLMLGASLRTRVRTLIPQVRGNVS